METFVVAVVGVSTLFLLVLTLSAPGQVNAAIMHPKRTRAGRAFIWSNVIIGILCVAVQIILWRFTGSARVLGVRPLTYFAAFFFSGFSIRGAYIWMRHRRNAGSPTTGTTEPH